MKTAFQPAGDRSGRDDGWPEPLERQRCEQTHSVDLGERREGDPYLCCSAVNHPPQRNTGWRKEQRIVGQFHQ